MHKQQRQLRGVAPALVLDHIGLRIVRLFDCFVGFLQLCIGCSAVSPQLGLHRIGSTSPCVAGIDDNAHCDLYHFIAHMWYFPS